MNSAKQLAMREPIHILAAELGAMSKVMCNDIKGRYVLCCIWIANNSNTAVAFSPTIGAAVKIQAFSEAAGSDFAECLDLAAGHAGLMVIQYANGFALTLSKFYDEFIAKNGVPISEDGTWKDFDYIDWKKILPEMAVCHRSTDLKAVFDPKKLILLNKVKEADEFNQMHADVQHRLVGIDNPENRVFVAAYPNMMLLVAELQDNPETATDPTQDMKYEYSFFKD